MTRTRRHAKNGTQRLKRATGQRTVIAGAFEAGRLMAAQGRTLSDVYPIYWRAHLRRAFWDGFHGSTAPASWRERT